MSSKIKYILSLIAAFLSLIMLGVVSIVLFRAKRTVAPEVAPGRQGVQAKPVTTQKPDAKPANKDSALQQQVTELRKQQFGVPSESSSVIGTLGGLPEPLSRALIRYLSAPRVFVVVYETGQKGYRLEEDSAVSFADTRQAWQDGLLKDRLLLSTKNSPTEMLLSAQVEKYRFVITLSKLTEHTTGQTIRIIEER
jgi:hypothetical protein